MIKLNNKNITYVALADSANSIKAPKEIWYADSSNSVKLVYRRKDALIEGEDYEKYHWLVGDGRAYIDVKGFSRNENWEITTKTKLKVSNDWILLYGVGYVENTFTQGVWTTFGTADATEIRYRTSNGTSYIDRGVTNIIENKAISIVDAHTQMYFNDTLITAIQNRTYAQCNEFYIFSHYYTNLSTAHKVANADFSDFTVKENGTKILNLIPCKLLKPIPKWLDANGIRRQVGECGMIDLVSGKFYGNVNSVGTFTVENYYERKEWLIIPYTQNDANALPIKSNNFSYQYIIYSVGNIAGLWTTNNEYAYYPNTKKCGIWGQSELTVVHINSNLIPLATPFDVECNSDGITMNGELMPNYGSSPYFDRLVIYCYTSTGKYALSKITVDDSIRYIPCTLTMDLPASMDANNIARTKGTSGMWDLVSDRFYGNVASSGTFKAVNLAEGVDYEVHQWLVSDIPIGTNMMSLPINSSTFSYQTVLGEQQANIGHFITNGYSYVTNNNSMDIVKIYDNVNKQTVSSSSVNSRSMGIESSENGMTVNGVNIQQLGFPVKNKLITSASNSLNATTTKTSKITVDGIERYIPVKLLRSIPSKYDANGIVRQAGECGMYDTVNDVFYGNVANSGTFSVSDDS